jgi:pyruvate dehydrogenase E2 component (dihydrolipoamide acetyltransferase)
MAVDFKLPDLGEGIHEAEIVAVRVKAGEPIKEDQIMFEVETDKALVEIPSPFTGTVTKVYVEAGKIVTVGSIMVTIDNSTLTAEAPKEKSEGQVKSQPQEHPASKTVSQALEVQPAIAAASSPPAGSTISNRAGNHIVPATPATRRLARELGVDLQDIVATGPGGRVFDNDVRAFAGKTSTAKIPAKPVGREEVAKESLVALPDFSSFGKVERVPLRSIRRKTAENMKLSWDNIPHVTHFDEADVTELEILRAKHEKAALERGGKLTLTVFMLKAVANALKQYPQFNSSLDQSELIYKYYYNVGVAVASERGLIVPVIRNVDEKPIIDLAVELAQIAEKTRSGKIELERLHGGTFTITNVGTIGGTGMVPMINYPEAAILGMAKAKQKPVVKDGKIEVRLIIPLALAFDHRINDGAEAAYFMNHVIKQLEEPGTFILEA